MPGIPSSLIGDSVGSFNDFTSLTCSVAPTVRGIWYKFTPTTDKILELRVTSATFNSRLVVFTGTCAVLSCFLQNDGGGSTAFLSWQGSASTEYLVLVTGVAGFGTVGTFDLAVSVSHQCFSFGINMHVQTSTSLYCIQ